MTAAALTSVVSSWTPSIEDIERGEELKIILYATKKFLDEIARLKKEISKLERLEGDAVQPVPLDKCKKALGRLVNEKRETLQESCAIIYQNAKIGTLPFVLGGESLRSEDKNAIAIARNFGILSGEATTAGSAVTSYQWPVETVPQTSPKTFETIPMELKRGSVLWDKTWSVFKNDCVMLGIIHSARECYIARIGKSTLDDDLWDKVKGRPRVLGREIAMLVRAGYVQTFPTVPSSSVSGKNLIDWSGYHFVCQDPEAASAITLKDLVDAVKTVSLEQLKKMFINHKEASCRPGAGSPSSDPTGGSPPRLVSRPLSAATIESRPGAGSPSSDPTGGSPPRLVRRPLSAATIESRPGAGSPPPVAATGGAGTG